MNDAPSTERSDTQGAIMAGTYRALCEHGYANLTTQAIADELDVTKAVLHYHYDESVIEQLAWCSVSSRAARYWRV